VADLQREYETIRTLCERLQELERRSWQVLEWPDESRPGQGECDALAQAGDHELWAIDHSRLQSFRRQSYDDRRFTDVVVPAEAAVKAEFPDEYVSLCIDVGAVPPRSGQNASLSAPEFSRELIDALRGVPVTSSHAEAQPRPTRLRLPGANIEVRAIRQTDRTRGCFVSRATPGDQAQQFVDELRD
jgi:hypothetical protein